MPKKRDVLKEQCEILDLQSIAKKSKYIADIINARKIPDKNLLFIGNVGTNIHEIIRALFFEFSQNLFSFKLVQGYEFSTQFYAFKNGEIDSEHDVGFLKPNFLAIENIEDINFTEDIIKAFRYLIREREKDRNKTIILSTAMKWDALCGLLRDDILIELIKINFTVSVIK